MTIEEPRWRWRSTREVHRGRVRIDADEVELPDGERITYEVDRSAPYSVATLVVLDGDVVLSRQYRYPIDRWILELPGGGGSHAHAPEEAARRELADQLGMLADRLTPLHVFATNPVGSVAKTHLFLATAVRSLRGATEEPAEQVRVVRMPLSELDRLIAEGEIADPVLLIARGVGAAKGLLPPLRG